MQIRAQEQILPIRTLTDMPSNFQLTDYKDFANLFRILGDKTRLQILSLLKVHELCVCEINQILHSTQSNISQHLARLRISGLVTERKSAQWIYYTLNKDLPENVKQIILMLPESKEDIDMILQSRETGQCNI